MPETARGVQRTGAVVAAVAAVSIALGASAPRWWSSEKASLEMGVGLREVELCGPVSCTERGLDGLGGASQTWPMLGAIAFPIGWVASVLLVAAAAFVALARRSRWTPLVGQAAAAAALFALVVGAGFAWTYPGFGGLGVGWALLAYLGGAVLGVGSAGLLIGAGGSRRVP